MQIARVVPKVKTSGEGVFDYAITPEILPQIACGVLVEVPFHGRNIEAVVIDIKRTSKIDVLKSIIRIIDPVPVVDKIHLELAKWMADYYLSSLGQTLFENIVPPAIRTINKQSSIVKNDFFSVPILKASSKSFLAIGDFSFRMQVYQKAIEKTLAKNKSVIILVPDISLIKYFKFKISPIVLHANMTKTERWLAWNKTRTNSKQIIIGSQSALFAPVKNLGLIIIDQEENETYKSDRSPRFHAVDTAYKLATISDANIILGSVCPRIETYYNVLNTKHRILLGNTNTKPDISIVDMNLQKSILSQPLIDAINNSLQQKNKTLLILNRKGEGTKYSCADCGWTALCEKCGLPLILQKDVLVCHNCEKKNSIPETCPKCNGVHLRSFGVGTKRLAKIVSENFPHAKIIIIDKDNPLLPNFKNWDIAIATTYALKINLPKFSFIGIVDGDQSLNFPEYLSFEKTFINLYKFLKIGERGIIQTHIPESPIYSALAKLNYQKFFLDEITKREKFNFPPFTRLIRLLYINTDQKLAQKETQNVIELIKLQNNDLFISGPSEPFIKKVRSNFRFQITIKTKIISDNLKIQLKNLGKNWTVDIDPMDLL